MVKPQIPSFKKGPFLVYPWQVGVTSDQIFYNTNSSQNEILMGVYFIPKTRNLKFLRVPLGVPTNGPRSLRPWVKIQNSAAQKFQPLFFCFQKGMSHCSRIKTLGGDRFSRKRVLGPQRSPWEPQGAGTCVKKLLARSCTMPENFVKFG